MEPKVLRIDMLVNGRRVSTTTEERNTESPGAYIEKCKARFSGLKPEDRAVAKLFGEVEIGEIVIKESTGSYREPATTKYIRRVTRFYVRLVYEYDIHYDMVELTNLPYEEKFLKACVPPDNDTTWKLVSVVPEGDQHFVAVWQKKLK